MNDSVTFALSIVMDMKKEMLICSIVLCWLSHLAAAQSLDSLQLALKKANNDIDRAKTLNALSDQYKYTQPKRTADYALNALQIAERIQYKKAQGDAYLNLGNAAIISGDYPKAMEYFLKARNIFETEISTQSDEQLACKASLAKAYGSIGIVLAEQSNYAKAIEYHLKAVKLYEIIKDAKKAAQVYNNIGVAYKSQSADFKALTYFVKALKLQEKFHDPNLGITQTNIANCYLKQKNYPQALTYYNQAKASIDQHPDARALGEWLNNMGLYHQQMGASEKAIASWNQSIKNSHAIGDRFAQADTHLYLGALYLSLRQFPQALSHAQTALQLANELNVLEQKMAAEKLLSDIYGRQNNSEMAFAHFKLYSADKDSLNNAESIRKGLEAEMNFEFEKREVLQKEALQKKELLLQEEAKKNRLELIFGGLLALLLAGIGFLYYNRMQLKKHLTLQKELAEYEQKALHLQMNPHFVFNCLGSISSFIVKNGTHSAVKYLAKFSKLMRLTLEYSKQSLIPIHKEIQSLENYLELEQLRFNHKFDFSITKDQTIEDDLALPPLLLQPFVENAIIHGVIPSKELGLIQIHFSIENDSLICTIQDNGIGFKASRAIKENSVSVHQSMALDITKKRLQMISSSMAQKAEVTIDDLTLEDTGQTGTRVTLYLPIQYISKHNLQPAIALKD